MFRKEPFSASEKARRSLPRARRNASVLPAGENGCTAERFSPLYGKGPEHAADSRIRPSPRPAGFSHTPMSALSASFRTAQASVGSREAPALRPAHGEEPPSS